MNYLVFIFHDGNRAHCAQIGESLFKQPCIVISVVCSFWSGPILNKGRNRTESRERQANIRENDIPDLGDSLMLCLWKAIYD